MPTTLESHTETITSANTWYEVYAAPTGTDDKSSLLLGCRIVNIKDDGLSARYEIEVNGTLFHAPDAHVLPRGSEDLILGGAVTVINKNNTVRVRSEDAGAIAVHLSIVERTA